MSSSDDKLDALYGAKEGHSADLSPGDVDDNIRTAARNAMEQELAQNVDQNGGSLFGWQQRYRWAGAAVLLLTTLVFVQLPDDQDPVGSARPDHGAPESPTPVNPNKPQEIDVQSDPPVASVPSVPPQTVQPSMPTAELVNPASAYAESSSTPAVNSRAAQAFRQQLDALPPMATPPTDAAVRRKKASSDGCVTYTGQLISRACPLVEAMGWELFLTNNSQCADQGYQLPAAKFPLSRAPQPVGGGEKPTADSPTVLPSFAFFTDDKRLHQLHCLEGLLQLITLEP